jgi:hypothetical protein
MPSTEIVLALPDSFCIELVRSRHDVHKSCQELVQKQRKSAQYGHTRKVPDTVSQACALSGAAPTGACLLPLVLHQEVAKWSKVIDLTLNFDAYYRCAN